MTLAKEWKSRYGDDPGNDTEATRKCEFWKWFVGISGEFAANYDNRRILEELDRRVSLET